MTPNNLCVGIITPTYHREKLLARLIRQVQKQSYTNWKLIVVHDGANNDTERLVQQFISDDERIIYLETCERGNDFGVTPRYEGLKYALENLNLEYCVFWDDDNYFYRDALARIVSSLEMNGCPDLLLMTVRYRRTILPPKEVLTDVGAEWLIRPGMVDTACFTVRPNLGFLSYDSLLKVKSNLPEKSFYTQDFMFFDFLRNLNPRPSIAITHGKPISIHDGLRPQVFLRVLLGIPPLNLINRFRFYTRFFCKK